MTDYTPTTEDVPEDDHTLTEAIKKLAVWAACQSDESRGIEAAEEIFDRWMTGKIRKAKAQAWHEGFCRGEVSGEREWPINPHTENPYTEG